MPSRGLRSDGTPRRLFHDGGMQDGEGLLARLRGLCAVRHEEVDDDNGDDSARCNCGMIQRGVILLLS